MKKVTAVQWLIHKLITENEVSLKGENYKLFELAKEIEKEQIIDFTRKAVRKILDEDRQNPFNLEQYYNETYKLE
jgi:hypothetical protein